ncbi:peptidyl-prolyl cis-trans isomerase D [Nitrosomonas sp. PY1]|uniref:SurA N-terminal domain-containing protein n=1 Tax=Nitrosomonas sp. PY1 TaxID=1803906 RepID=UPI001FC86FC6|nr:SurA N-terminal domain-containing protein [Nitrosomonas sp. PY1]GKS69736.1 peptidyl-prolyl cis-trans isomerase D [Nitrosomonas sp. PY1]
MFDFVNRKKRIVQIIMALAVLPFLFWGVESYRDKGDDGFVAIVESDKISRREFEQALRDHHERVRGMMGANFDSSMLDNFEVRNSVLERLVQQRLIQSEAEKNGFVVLDSQIIKTIREIQAFQKDGKFSKQQYEDLLRAQGLTPALFESRVRKELMIQQLMDGYSENAFVPSIVAKKVSYLSEVQREVSQSITKTEQFVSEIQPSESEIKSYYDKNQADFYLPEQVRVEYVVLSLADVAKKEVISDEAIEAYYAEHLDSFVQPEERKASHILISVAADASPEDKQLAREKVQKVQEQIKQNPERFAEIAKEFSDDPGSANSGGDLGFFGRGVMVKPFEEQIFSMQTNEISDVVETDFGFHVIQLNDIKAEKRPQLQEVREQIEQQLKIQAAGKIFGEISEDFSNMVYEQNENLQAVADKLDLIINKSEWLTKNGSELPILSNDRLLSAIFSSDAITGQKSTEVIEIEPDTFAAARVIEHQPETVQPLAVVETQITETLKKKAARAKAIEIGQKKLAQLQQATSHDTEEVTWDEPKLVSYMRSQNMNSEELHAVFKADTKELPVYVGLESPDGFTLLRISKVIEPSAMEKEKLDAFRKQLQQMITQEETVAYLSGLRKQYDVKINQDGF